MKSMNTCKRQCLLARKSRRIEATGRDLLAAATTTLLETKARRTLRLTAARALLALAWGCAVQGQTLSNTNVIPPDQTYAGKTYGEWAAGFWQYYAGLPTTNHPFERPTGYPIAPLGTGQSGPVWFLDGNLYPGGTFAYTDTVPAGVALFTLVTFDEWGNDRCDGITYTEDQMRTNAAAKENAVTQMAVAIDGVAVTNIDDVMTTPYRVQSPLFDYTCPSVHNVLYDVFGRRCFPPGDGTPYTINGAIVDGVFLMITPLSAGQHTIQVSTVIPSVLSETWTRTLNVLPVGPSQPTITSLILNGKAQTGNDTVHPYLNDSLSPGALVYFTATVTGGLAPLSYQWQLDGTNLLGETSLTLGAPGAELQPGDYTFSVTDASGSNATRTVSLGLDPTFSKIMTDPIVTYSAPNCSVSGAWADFNNDGYLDLFVCNGVNGTSATPFLFTNNGDGSFTRVTSGPPVDVPASSVSACWGDYDNDGNLDLCVANTTGFTAGAPNFLYHNDGGGTFHRITSGSIVTDSFATLSVGWVDYDQDGFLDLFATTFDPNGNSQCQLYRNDGDGTFSSVTEGALVTDLGSSAGFAWGDYDNDGKTDLFVCGSRNLPEPLAPNRLYHNEGGGTFTRVSDPGIGSIVTDVGYSKSCCWGDYDNDGFLDLVVADTSRILLYHNNGSGTFTRILTGDVANDTGVNLPACAWGDYDNDGFLDLFVTDEDNASPVANHLYHNNGDGTFTKVTTGSPVNEFSNCRGCAWVDYDNDGFLDLFAARGDGRGNYLYHNNWRNNGTSNGWVTVKLVGTVSNRSAIGAKVRVNATIRGKTFWQLRQITGGSGFSGCNELQANFGLGDATNADTVRIEWPSGTVQEFHNVAPRQTVTYTEPPRLMAGSGGGVPQFSIKGGRFMQYDIQASTNLAAWSSVGTVTVTNMNGTAAIPDPGASGSDRRFYRAMSH